MGKIKKITKWLLGIIIVLYLCLCGFYYFFQDKLLFNTSAKLKPEHVFKFSEPFEERYISMPDNKKLNGVLFKAKESKGLILWFPGGRGMIDSIGVDSHFYTDLKYDLFILNYRGFGKSEGKISSEKQFNQDMQSVYDYFKKEYAENKIILLGYSLGTGPAAALASANNPKVLVLQAPYYSIKEEARRGFPYLPIDLLQRYEFSTYSSLQKTKCPVLIFHGDADKKIPVAQSYELEKKLKPTDQLIVLKDQGHNRFLENATYLKKLQQLIK
ncbi:alpha/beta hydrolase [Flavobacterium limnophilum]|uniref:alpha/beta hydrolase n=1 Tax=Flavobacterium limnophilum TaxID=3003262 RepID=UPI002482F6F3|nr:alpha/beta fold hydrolase [Flavobacterium limnophilum]